MAGESCPNWVATGTVTVPKDATLTIQPGTTIKFDAGALLVVDGGVLKAQGTEKKPIVLTGEEAVPGYWQGLVFYKAPSSQNHLSHVTVEYAGGAKYVWADAPAGVVLTGDTAQPSRVTIEHSTLRHSAGYGIFLGPTSLLPDFQGNTLTANVEGAAYVHPASAGLLATGNVYTGNTKDRVRIKAGDVKTDVAVQAIGVRFESGSISVKEERLSFAPGVEVAFEAGAELYVDGGKLSAVGTGEAPVVFTGVEQSRGFWKGIVFYKSASTENALEHAVVEYAGGAKDVWANAAANLVLSHDTSRVRVSNTRLQHGAGYGLYVNHGAALTDFVGNTLTDNAQGAAYVYASSADALQSDNIYAGNDKELVFLGKRGLNKPATWSALDVPFFVSSGIEIGKDGHLTIAPGARVEFDSNTYLTASDGLLTAAGTEENRIVLTRADGATGWQGVQFYRSSSTLNKVEYVDLSHGGSSKYVWAGSPAGLAVTGTSTVSVAHSRFFDNAGYGLWIESDATVTGCATATFEGNGTDTPNEACD